MLCFGHNQWTKSIHFLFYAQWLLCLPRAREWLASILPAVIKQNSLPSAPWVIILYPVYSRTCVASHSHRMASASLKSQILRVVTSGLVTDPPETSSLGIWHLAYKQNYNSLPVRLFFSQSVGTSSYMCSCSFQQCEIIAFPVLPLPFCTCSHFPTGNQNHHELWHAKKNSWLDGSGTRVLTESCLNCSIAFTACAVL